MRGRRFYCTAVDCNVASKRAGVIRKRLRSRAAGIDDQFNVAFDGSSVRQILGGNIERHRRFVGGSIVNPALLLFAPSSTTPLNFWLNPFMSR